MKCSKRLFSVVSVLFAVLLSLGTGTLNARDADLAPVRFAQQHRRRDQPGLKQVFASLCRRPFEEQRRETYDQHDLARVSVVIDRKGRPDRTACQPLIKLRSVLPFATLMPENQH